MARMNFGDVLRDARERRGYDLAGAARQLRIRPDILRAIEECDFSRMPPRGYTRNMVGSYARLLGLNASELTRMYLDEAYAFQVGRVRADEPDYDRARSSQRPSGRSSSRTAPTRDGRSPARGRSRQQEERAPRQNAFGRTQYDDRPSNHRRSSLPSHEPAFRDRLSDRTHPSRQPAVPSTQYTNFYSGPRSSGNGVQSRLPFIIAGGIILVLLIIILFMAFGRGGDTSSTDVPKVPVTGMATTSSSTSESGDAATTETPAVKVETAPTKATLTYSVSSGAAPYVELYQDDSETPYFSQTVTGPASQSIDVTGKVTITTPQPSNLTVEVDGTKVDLEEQTAGVGVYAYTVDFPAILEAWTAAHPTTTSSSSTASSTAASSSSGTSSTSTSTAA